MKNGLFYFSLFALFPVFAIAQQKPNILWITFEDTSPQFIGCYGNSDARTTVMDKLAAQGVRFTNAFSTGTVCSPSRSTIITGVRTYELGTGNHRSNYRIPDNIHGFPFYLKKGGYYTSNNAKTDYNVWDEKSFIKDAWHESSGKAGWWNRAPGQPFFAVFNFMDSHQSRTMTDPYEKYVKTVLDKLPAEDRIAETDFSMPPFYMDSPEMRKQFARVYNAIKLTDNKIGELLEKLKADHLMDSTVIFCFADHGEGIPRGKTNGINLGYRVPFFAWFPPMYEHLSPWKTGGIVTNELIDFEDLAPTMLSLAGEQVPDYLKGRILIGKDRSKPVDHLILSNDRADNGIDMTRSVTNGKYLYSRNYYPFMPEARYINYMEIGEIKVQMRKDLAENKLNPLQKNLFEERPAEFLFNIEKDKWETLNLINDPTQQQVLAKMRTKLDIALTKSRDILFLPEFEISEISKQSNLYDYRLNNTTYPFREIYAAASLAGKRGAEITVKQIKLLKSPNKIIRYWAAVGLMAQHSEDLEKYKTEIINASRDLYPPAAIVLSAISWSNFQDKPAQETLSQFILNRNEYLCLLALNMITYGNGKDGFIEPVKQLLENQTLSYELKSAGTDFLHSAGRNAIQ